MVMGLKHVLLLLGIIGGLGGVLISVPSWEALFTPAVVGSMLVNLSSSIGAVFVNKPGAENEITIRRE